MDATKQEIQGLITNYEKALKEYPLSKKEKEQCMKKIEKLKKMKDER